MTGTFQPDMDMVITREAHKERIGKLYTLQGKKLEEVPFACRRYRHSGKACIAQDKRYNFAVRPAHLLYSSAPPPLPVHMLAISAVNKKEERQNSPSCCTRLQKKI
jgi:hypothetical protein